MEASPLPTGSIEDWTEQFDQTLRDQRERVREFLAAQQQRLRGAEDALGRQLDQLARLLAEERSETHQTRQELEQRRQHVARETEALEAIRRELDQRRTEWEQLKQQSHDQHCALAEQINQGREELGRFAAELDVRRQELDRDRAELDERRHEIDERRKEVEQHSSQLDRRSVEADQRRAELDRRQSEIEAAEAELRNDRQALEAKCRQLDADRQQIDELRQQLDARGSELQGRLDELTVRESETQAARRRIARELRDRHAAQLREIDRRKEELHRRDTAEQEELRRRLDSAEQHGSELSEELEQLRAAHAQLRKQLTEQSDDAIDPERFAALRSERDRLADRLADAERRLADAQQQSADDRADDAQAEGDFRRRYELAMEDLRELKKENAALREQLGSRPKGGPPPAASAAGGALNWEAEKQRILAALEDDFDEADEEDRPERLEIEEVVRRTDAIVAEKDREIAELQQLLDQQAGSVGDLAVGAAALGEVLDSDAIIQEERENLKKLQEEWREKLRQAEIDISVERAKLGRERKQLEEKLRTVENGAPPVSTTTDGDKPPDKQSSGRWLQRLGLGNRDEE